MPVVWFSAVTVRIAVKLKKQKQKFPDPNNFSQVDMANG